MGRWRRGWAAIALVLFCSTLSSSKETVMRTPPGTPVKVQQGASPRQKEAMDSSVGKVSTARINYISHLEVACQDARHASNGAYSRLSADSGHCYILVIAPRSFRDAEKVCASGGGRLSSLTTETEVGKLGSFYVHQPFIGYHFSESADDWEWSSGELPIMGSGKLFEHWAKHGQEKGGDCVSTNKKGFWVRSSCDEKRPFICELEPTELVEVIRPRSYEEEVNGNIIPSKPQGPGAVPSDGVHAKMLQNTNEGRMILAADKKGGHQSAKDMFHKYINSWVSAYEDIRAHFRRRDIMTREILQKFFLKPEENGLPRIENYIRLGHQRIRGRVFEELAYFRELIDRLENIFRLKLTISKFVKFIREQVTEMHGNYKAGSRGRREIDGVLRKLKLRYARCHEDVYTSTKRHAKLVKSNAKAVNLVYHIEEEEHKIKPTVTSSKEAVRAMASTVQQLYEVAQETWKALPKMWKEAEKNRVKMQEMDVIMGKLEKEVPSLHRSVRSGIVQRHKTIKGVSRTVRFAAKSEDNFQEAVVNHISKMSGQLAGGFWTGSQKQEAEDMFNKALDDMRLHFLHLKHTILEEIRFWTKKVSQSPDAKASIGLIVENASARVMDRLNGKGLGDEAEKEAAVEKMVKVPESSQVSTG